MIFYSFPSSIKFAIAPMLGWTDRHCRFFYRLLTKKALLYTEMIVADAVIHGVREQLLALNHKEHPIALQLGGSDPQKLAEAARIAEDFGYDEINLNVGCPSNRVQSGAFGACLMLYPDIVASAVEAIKKVVTLSVTVKCRVGVDDQDEELALDLLADKVWNAGCDALWVHARKAWLKGLSPKENRDIPPLNYNRVYKLKRKYHNKFIGINGGIKSIYEIKEHLILCDAAMVGRQVYHDPTLLKYIDSEIYGEQQNNLSDSDLIEAMCDYAAQHIASGGLLSHVTRHMIGLFHGRNGARRWRQILSNNARGRDAGIHVLKEAFSALI
ncbi:tRNA dihydrouridine(20/20a) synthase DusA [Bartonella henselae]|uniref:tRNA-dihydrouridine(20/20a) synthase n=1 Tax=Bartonella henselae (strain ATCC 49882 / DSM 28221 / CCUG 30454 / Houston 1) TaxID=283166 RepID=A0A0H3LWM9_BARHE|nr:tRNA dihydrouridine(20/20a) synthase DusA [Bartonella henselae]ATP13132.1 tRNA dihydrouridine(20/20a) synthase DusA [Bartonella henselae]MDM9983416.1 tRNA dihydrouridine(20/20a) synthase DusA [Bartonella henselae]MDM9985018.1 tRNA dihydrouridine(20/20a) synthase DusA [Bartonella henselae]MDM9986966.1 tRNA dihydrouridine(20/20a) synthase DusA [Bartonella henselae]MDM9988435.1 tRNA dihydrouridine(20/20a) synthase DusA [Bartonella henselae]